MAGLIRPVSEKIVITSEEDQANDFDISVDLLYQSFITWHRLENEGLVTTQRRDDIQFSETWHHRYPEKFQLLHRGSRCAESLLIGKGKYSKVYQRGTFAYKIVKIGHNRDQSHLAKLKCNVKEMCFFHSMDHANIMRAGQSQMVMEHGAFKKLIHEMDKARCTLQQMIYSHEITCFQDLVYMTRGIAKGLQYMHKFHIVHGDIKPSNVLITHRYESQISDFTLTTFETKGHEIAFGTLFWRSPECLLMQACNTSADVWSFGVIILDCLYGCNYMKDVMHGTNNEDLISKLSQLLAPASPEWTARCLPGKEHLLQKSDPEVMRRIQESKIQITVSDKELELVQDLISRILVWDEGARPSMEEVLKHPFFVSKAINPLPRTSENPMMDAPIIWKYNQMERVWSIQWRDRSERQFIQRWAKYYYHQIFKLKMPEDEDWLLYDIVILSKRVIDRIKLLETTFHVKHIIKACCQFLYFIWKDYWPEDPLFECVMFHILYLLRFNIFALKVEETYAHEATEKIELSEPSAHETKTSLSLSSNTPPSASSGLPEIPTMPGVIPAPPLSFSHPGVSFTFGDGRIVTLNEDEM